MSDKYDYRKHGHDPYYGHRLITISSGSREQYIPELSYLVRDEDGRLGSVGAGNKWFMNYIADAGTWCFNPRKEEDFLWSPFHHAYFYKGYEEHFKFPLILGEPYILKDGEKQRGFWNVPVPKLPDVSFKKEADFL